MNNQTGQYGHTFYYAAFEWLIYNSSIKITVSREIRGNPAPDFVLWADLSSTIIFASKPLNEKDLAFLVDIGYDVPLKFLSKKLLNQYEVF